ncbi:uncharacterized protein LAESUDRAFT_761884 [Laetiporus sulphureus 93-53]|uniref:Mitochondrial escape protein 2 n=1 Tax=Laetiporus sulphureus 93-53 TaxID=1314785 RepID=A0A165CVX4_9APHY|nr:uncharacterized protein LAESUDRAFT_761884 [Laetiporus sulphureus 93-53]KZT03537.1 hypothetical protein LAESUDRAFT_761884 [Laetiporus sulphureus 93-53]
MPAKPLRLLKQVQTQRWLQQRGNLTNVLARCYARRSYSDVTAAEASKNPVGDSDIREGCLFIDSVFPIRLGAWDVRRYLGYFREETILDRLRSLFAGITTHGFQLLSLQPHEKDGGVFVKFRYTAGDPEPALESIVHDLREKAAQQGGIPSWAGLSRSDIWLIKGKPWREDMNRFPSPLLRVAFEGPDVPEESLYNLLRPYGRIQDLTQPLPPSVPGGLRYSTVTFGRVRSAAIAHNAIHGSQVRPSPSSSSATVLRTTYQPPVQAHAFRDYVTGHPRIFLPVVIFLLGALTYTIFDPIRELMVEGKLEGWFDVREFRMYQWLRSKALQGFSLSSNSEGDKALVSTAQHVWKERQDAESALERYLTDMPNSVAFIHGPQGSGKTPMIAEILEVSGRKALIIDVAELSKKTSDTALVAGLAQQTGYWPVFSVFNSLSNVIDLASVGLIGQKAGFSSSLTDQLKQILEVTGIGLARVNATHRKQRDRTAKNAYLKELKKEQEERRSERIREGLWHDPRLDCIAGNGVMSELGVGDERFGENDVDARRVSVSTGSSDEKDAGEKHEDETKRRSRTVEDVQAVESMPVVIIKNFESKGGGQNREETLDVLARWAASLVQNQVAHVLVASDNRENAKRLAKALSSQPLTVIALSDADYLSALSFVKEELHDVGVNVDFDGEERAYVQRLGGRASDLESLVHKVRSGLSVQEAVDDIITRGVSEIRKNAFGDDLDDAKNLPWTREQAWALMKKLARQPEISYHEVLLDFPFKNDEMPLRHMEHAELISIATENGRPSTIKPGKPVYRFVFERLVQDSVFQASQDIAFNEKVIAASESIVKACEQELLALKDVNAGTSDWWGSRTAVRDRSNYLLKKMRIAEEKIEALEKQNGNLRKVLSK